MDWKNPFRKGPKALDGPATHPGSGDASPLGDAIVANEAVRKKQMLLLGARGGLGEANLDEPVVGEVGISHAIDPGAFSTCAPPGTGAPARSPR